MEKKGAIPEPLIISTPLCEVPFPTLSPLSLLASPPFVRLGLGSDLEEQKESLPTCFLTLEGKGQV